MEFLGQLKLSRFVPELVPNKCALSKFCKKINEPRFDKTKITDNKSRIISEPLLIIIGSNNE